MTPRKKAIAHVRQLCTLGLPAETLGPVVLEALHAVVPSLHNRMIWCDAARSLTGLYCEAPEMYAYGKYFLEELDNRLPDFPGTRFVLSRPRGVGFYLPIVTTPEYFRGVYHNEIERPVGGYHFLDMVIGDASGNVGAILLARDAKSKPFAPAELQALNELVPHVAHAMRHPSGNSVEPAVHASAAVLVASRDGEFRYATPLAQQWLSQAFHSHARRGDILDKLRTALPAPLVNLCRSLAAPSKRVPSLTLSNAWGQFKFTAAPLRPGGPDGGDLVALTIEFREPRVAAVARNARAAGLSPAQTGLCLQLMSADEPEHVLANRLGIRKTTVRDHFAKIYRKFDVHGRDELMRRLTAPPATTNAWPIGA